MVRVVLTSCVTLTQVMGTTLNRVTSPRTWTLGRCCRLDVLSWPDHNTGWTSHDLQWPLHCTSRFPVSPHTAFCMDVKEKFKVQRSDSVYCVLVGNWFADRRLKTHIHTRKCICMSSNTFRTIFFLFHKLQPRLLSLQQFSCFLESAGQNQGYLPSDVRLQSSKSLFRVSAFCLSVVSTGWITV